MAKSEVAIIEKLNANGMEATAAEALLAAYGVPFTEAGKILNDYPLDDEGNISLTDASIVVKDESDTDAMAKARQTRLELRTHRIAIEKKHDELKADSLAYGKAVDLVQREALAKIKPVEEYLQLQEKYAETLQEQRRQARIAERTAELAQYVDDVSVYNYGDMGDDAFALLLDQVKDAKEKQIAAEKEAAEKAEQERREREEADKLAREKAEAELAAERERNQKKLDRISSLSRLGFSFVGSDGYKYDELQVTEQFINDASDEEYAARIKSLDEVVTERKELQKQAAEQEAARVKKIEEQAAADRKAAEDAAREKAAAEAAAAEQARLDREAAEKAAAAPDKEKLLQYVEQIGSVKFGEVTSEKGKAVEARIAKHLATSLQAYRDLIAKEL